MIRRLSRRDALRLSSLGAFSMLHPPLLLGGCSSSASKDKGAPGTSGDAGPPPPLVYDPNVSWWMQHNYGPVEAERDAGEAELTVEGAIPPELDGLYVRNGSNPDGADPGHWFLGQGMVHGVRLSGGRALWYKNRYLRTPMLGSSQADGGLSVGPPDLEKTASNVSLVHHAGRLLSLGEVGYPYELSPEDLSTVGLYDFAGKLTTSMTAHPKIDPVTGEMLMFAYWFAEPYLTYHHVDAAGVLTRSEPITMKAPVMMHDFQATASKIVFMDLPIVFDLEMAIAGSSFPFKWNAANGARIGIMPRDGGDADVVWIDIDPCFVFHTLNAYDDPSGKVILEASRFEELWVNGNQGFDAIPQLHRFTLDPAARTATLDKIDERMLEFPQLDRRKAGRKHRYGYGLWLADPEGQPHPNGVRGIIKLDRDRDTSTVHELDAALQADEAFFVPASATAGEDEGWLLTYVYDRRTERTALHIIDATDMTKGPVAKVWLPFRIPFGFHGFWVPVS
jgi:carotenoid cleavage dioxygenase